MANVFTSGFFMVGPLVLLGQTIVGANGERLEPFFSITGFTNYTGYLAAIDVNSSIIIFSSHAATMRIR